MTNPTRPAQRYANAQASPDSEGGELECESHSGREAATAVARGTKLLSILSQQAAAARAEAQCAELQMLIDEAREGDSLRLQRWLQTHASEHSLAAGQATATTTLSSCDATLAAGAEALTRLATAAKVKSHSSPADEAGHATGVPDSGNALPASSLDSWQTLLAPARARLLGHVERIRSSRATVVPRTNEQSVAGQGRRQLEELAKRFDPALRQTQQAEHKRQRLFFRLRGAVASAVAHGVLIFLLAWITLRQPTPPASLGLQASPAERVPEALEISQPLEVSQPDSAAESSSVSDSFDVSETLTDASANVSLALGQLPAPASSSLPSHNLLASSAAAQLMQSNATFYGAAASGNCFCYVIDGSGSMRNGPWDAAKLELLKSLATLKEKQRFYIIFFNRELSAIPLPGEQTPAPAALYATHENLTHTRRWLDTLHIDAGAPPNDALSLAIDKEPDAIYLLTDGVTTVDVPKFLRDKNRISDLIAGEQVRVPIHTIAFYSLAGQALLKQVAAENQGQFIYVPAPRR